MTEQRVKPGTTQRAPLGYWDLLGISLGQIVGGGVVILTGIGIGITGYGTPWAFILALAIVALPSLCIAALGSAIPSTGGTYTYVRDLIGGKTAFLYLGLMVAGQLVLASYALGFADYAATLLPQLNLRWIAGTVMTLCYGANLLGLKTAARLQAAMVILLLGSLLVFVGFGLPRISTYGPYFAADTVLPGGLGGLIAAAYLLRYSMIGSEFISELGGETRNPGKTIPRVIVSSLAFVTVLYFLVALVATGVLPLHQVRGQSLAFVAKEVLPPAIYLVFMIGGVMLALVTSLNSVFAWCTKGLYMATRDGWFPQRLAVTNRFGVAYLLLTVFYIVGMLPILTGTTLTYVTILGNAVGIVFGIIPVLALINLHARNPQAWEQAPFRLSIRSMKVLPVVALVIYAYGVYLSFADFITVDHLLSLAAYLGLLIAYAVWREPQARSTKETK